jgi:hypothetical protein
VQIEGVYDPEDAGGSILFDNYGNKLPPFIAMEKGESLIDWSGRNTSDVFQAVTVRPANTLYRPATPQPRGPARPSFIRGPLPQFCPRRRTTQISTFLGFFLGAIKSGVHGAFFLFEKDDCFEAILEGHGDRGGRGCRCWRMWR